MLQLKDAMKTHKITGRFICSKLDWTETRISNKLNNRSPMTMDEYIKVCAVVDVHPASLFPGFSFVNTLDKLSIIDIFRQLIDEQIKKEFESKKIISRVEY